MHDSVRRAATAAAAVALLASAVVATAPAAHAAEPGKRPPVPVAGVAGPASPRLDQDTTQTVTVTGASRLAPVTVSWGDGTSRSSQRTSCPASAAIAQPAACAVAMSHGYTSVGTFPITVRSGERVIARTTVAVRPAPRPWSPPDGWTQPRGWAAFRGGATYVPCSTVPWFYDSASEPAAAAGMRAEVVGGLALLAAQTGLAFVETPDRPAATLTYSWADLSVSHGSAAGLGGRRGRNGFVTFSSTDWWPTDQWPGYGIVVQPDGTSALGRGWLVVHETMHALGLDHVDDPRQIMNPVAGRVTALGAGDLDGLRTMYLNNPCPV